MTDDCLRVMRAIRDEACAANDVIAPNRDGRGSGRIKVANAMARIQRMASEAIAKAGDGQ